MEKKIIEHHGQLSSDDSDFDVAYWSSLTTEERFDAAWELVKYYYSSKGKKHELRLRRTITTVGKMEGGVRDYRRIRSNGTQRTARN